MVNLFLQCMLLYSSWCLLEQLVALWWLVSTSSTRVTSLSASTLYSRWQYMAAVGWTRQDPPSSMMVSVLTSYRCQSLSNPRAFVGLNTFTFRHRNFFPGGFKDKCWLSELLRWRWWKKLLEHSRIECCCTVSVLEVSLAAFIGDLLEIFLTCNTLHSLRPKPPAGIVLTVNVRTRCVRKQMRRATQLENPSFYRDNCFSLFLAMVIGNLYIFRQHSICHRTVAASSPVAILGATP